MFFGFYYTLLTLVWVPWATTVNWGSFVSSEPAYFIGGIIACFCTIIWSVEKEERAQALLFNIDFLVPSLKLKAMWYNKVVMDNDNILDKEKYYVNDVWEIEEECGIDIMGNFVCEFWSEE